MQFLKCAQILACLLSWQTPTLTLGAGQAQRSQTWRTHWNGLRLLKDSPQRLPPEVHAPADPSEFSWELQGFNSKDRTGSVPIYTTQPLGRGLNQAGFKDSGTRVEVVYLRAEHGVHYYGVFALEDKERLKPFWVAGYHLKKMPQ